MKKLRRMKKFKAAEIDLPIDESAVQKIVRLFLSVIFNGFFILGVLTFFYQSITYVWRGKWHSISLSDAFMVFASGSFQKWLESPASWLGLHRILTDMPLSLFSIALPFVAVWLCLFFQSRR